MFDHPMAPMSNNEDDVHKAIDVAIEGKMNPEAFKKFMPKSYAALRGNFDRSLSESLFDRVFKMVQTKMMKHDPSIVTQLLPYQVPDQPEHHLDIKAILILLCHAIGTDTVINDTPYQPRFVKAFRDNIERRCGIFPITVEEDDHDNGMIRHIYYSAYLATAYEFQEEIEKFHTNMKLDQVCIRVHDEDGFIQGLISGLQSCVVELPSQVSTAEDLLQDVEQHYRARAVTNSFVKSVQVIKELPDFYNCLRCWVCGADDTKSCATCKVANFCGRKCQASAWRKNHKLLCPHYQRTMKYATTQCRRIEEVRQQNFIPGSLLRPNQFFDYNTIFYSAAMEASRVGEPLRPPDRTPSMDHFYENLVKVANDKTAFRSLFKRDTQTEGTMSDNKKRAMIPSLTNVCVGLAYNGHAPDILPGPKITRSSFLKAYCDLDNSTKQSEEMATASVTEDLWRLHNNADYRNFPKDFQEELRAAIANPEIMAD